MKLKLGYTGEVNCKLKINNKIVEFSSHNKGESELFRIIAKALAGYNITAEKPSMIDIRKYDPENDTVSDSLLKQPAQLVGGAFRQETIDSVQQWVTVYNASIDRSLISDASYYGDVCAVLMSPLSDLAYTQIENIDDANIIQKIRGQNNVQALIEWKMYVNNASNS